MTITDTTSDRDLLAEAWTLIYRGQCPDVLEPLAVRFERLTESEQLLEEENSALNTRIVDKDNDIDELRALVKEKDQELDKAWRRIEQLEGA